MPDTSAGDESGGGRALGFRRTVSIIWPVVVLPVAIIGGLVVAQYAPDSVESFYTDQAVPFLIAFWIGSGFTMTWRLVGESMVADKTPPGIVAAVGIISAVIFLSMLGGVRLLWEDPWLFGVAVAPGFAMGRPLLDWALRLLRRRPQPAPSPERSD